MPCSVALNECLLDKCILSEYTLNGFTYVYLRWICLGRMYLRRQAEKQVKHRLYRTAKQARSQDAWEKYDQCNLTTKLEIINAKRKYFNEDLGNIMRTNPKNFWTVVNPKQGRESFSFSDDARTSWVLSRPVSGSVDILVNSSQRTCFLFRITPLIIVCIKRCLN